MNYLEATKYPKTMHFDFSESLQNDDRRLTTLKDFEGEQVIVTEKLDGENATIYNDYYHPRSVIDDGHESRSWLTGFISTFQYMIPKNLRVCGESMYAEHSIRYEELKSFFYVFSIWNNNTNICLSWDMTKKYCDEWGLETVPVLYEGIFDYDKIKEIYKSLDYTKQEGIVCRRETLFFMDEFQTRVAKGVRPKHVNTDEHWKKTWKPNKLKI